MKSRSTLVAAAAALAIAGGVAAGIVVATGGAGEPKTSRDRYLAQVNAICEKYGEQLDRIAPPDISSPGDVFASIGLALPVLASELKETRSLEPPAELRPQLDQFFALSEQTLTHLGRSLRAAEQHDFARMAQAFFAFERTRNQAQALSKAIGFDC
jgi:hypothetical protein